MTTQMPESQRAASLVILIPARNEADMLAMTLEQLGTSVAPGDSVVVIDDGSTDGTAEVARQGGAQVCVRPTALGRCSTKGEALGWWATHPDRENEAHMGVVVLDADSLVGRNFCDQMRARLLGGAAAAQSMVLPARVPCDPIGEIAAYSELLEQKVADRLRGALGWPVRLRGTGMAFRREVFLEAVAGLITQVEDVELSLRLATRGVHIQRVPEASVFDPKPPDNVVAARQRARWLRGQLQVWWHYRSSILRLAMRGPWAWSLLKSLLLKPRSLMAAAKAIGVGIVWALGSPAGSPLWIMMALLLVSLAGDLAFTCLGVSFLAGRRVLLRRGMYLAVYPLWWLAIVALAVRAPRGWLTGPRSIAHSSSSG